jgi:uncharacterized phage protein (TIGR02218 family)
MKALTVPLKAHYALGTTTLTTCWKATLKDGTIVRCTAHDVDIEYPSGSGEIYVSLAGYTPSDVVNAMDMSPDNMELTGFLASPAITEADIQSGRWDYAEIEVFTVNYNDLSAAMGRNLTRKGTLGELTGSRSVYKADLRGLMQALSYRIVKVTTKDCTANLGDTRCGINRATYTVIGALTEVTSTRIFTDSNRGEAADWFTAGVLTFTSGANSGLEMKVMRFSSGGLFELHEAMPFEVLIGDTYSVYAGCTSRFTEDCIEKFSNGARFRGFPHMPLASMYNKGMR